jgi:uncharacterized membrane protein YfcA
MPLTTLLLAGVASGLLAGVLSGVFGIGGGIVLVPLLGLLLGLDQHAAQGVTLAVLLLPVGLPAVLAYHRRAPLRLTLVAALVAGFVAGVGGGARLAAWVPERPMRLLFVGFLVLVAVRGWRASPATAAEAPVGRSAWHGLWIGAVGGVLAGLLGIGGGIVMVPLLAGVLRLPRHEAQGASLATMLPPVGLPGVLVYTRTSGGLPWPLVAALAAGFALGALLGARVAARTAAARLTRAFAVFVAAVAAALAWKALAG